MKSPIFGAILLVSIIWILWLTDLHPHFNPSAPPDNHHGAVSWWSTWKSTSTDESIEAHQAATLSILPSKNITTEKCYPPTRTKKLKDRPLILFAFYETKLSRKNFEFFLRHGLHDAADFLFVINGETDAVKLIPSRPNIVVVRRKNDCFDMGAFAELLVKDGLYKRYNHFITMNASIRGPFFPTWSNDCWSDIYLSKLSDKVKLVGMTLSCRPLPHVQSMIWATDRIGMETLLFPSSTLVEKFKAELPPHDDSNPVPPWKTPGIYSCPHEYWDAVAVEVYATPLMRSAGYEVDVLMAAYHSIPDYENACRADQKWDNGDVLPHGNYFGMDVHPFDTIFEKTNRGADPLVMEKMTAWTDQRNYSSYDYCH